MWEPSMCSIAISVSEKHHHSLVVALHSGGSGCSMLANQKPSCARTSVCLITRNGRWMIRLMSGRLFSQLTTRVRRLTTFTLVLCLKSGGTPRQRRTEPCRCCTRSSARSVGRRRRRSLRYRLTGSPSICRSAGTIRAVSSTSTHGTACRCMPESATRNA